MKKTPLYQEHLKLNSKMTEFAGWEIPLQYTGIIDEHLTVRNKVGLFDISHMGKFFVSGDDSLELLQSLVPQDISKLIEGKAVYTQFINHNGGIIDDLIIYKLRDKEFLLIVNASRTDKDFEWIKLNKNNYEFELVNKTDQLTLIAIQGPLSSDLLNDLGVKKEDQPAKFSVKETYIDSFPVLICRTGYTGEDGFEILIDKENAVAFWRKCLSKGEKYEIKPIGLGARDTLRLEASLPLYGQDLDENTTPVEASLGWTVAKDKKENYSGKEIILSQLLHQNNTALNKKLIAFKMLDRSIPRHNYEIYINDKNIGYVTSGGIAPYLDANIGFGYINLIGSVIGTKIGIKIRDKLHPAEIVKKPFYTRNKR